MISDNLTLGSKKNVKSFSSGAIAESKLEKGLLYYGTDRGLFWTSKKMMENHGRKILQKILPMHISEVYTLLILESSSIYGNDWNKL